MNKVKIGLDIDGLIAGFYEEMHKRFPKDCPKYIKHWFDPDSNVTKHWKEIEQDYNFWANLPVLTPPEQIPFEIDCYITAIPATMYEARWEWLIKNGYPNKPLFVAYDKLAICKSRKLDWFVDDKPTTVKELNEGGIKCIQYKPWYFTDDIPGAVSSFNEIYKIIYDKPI